MQTRPSVIYFRRRCRVRRSRVRCTLLFLLLFFIELLCGMRFITGLLFAMFATFVVWLMVLRKC